MAWNLLESVKAAIKDTMSVRSETPWTDSIVVLHWLNEQGSYKQFVANRVNKILEKGTSKWNYIPTRQNLTYVWWVGGWVGAQWL